MFRIAFTIGEEAGLRFSVAWVKEVHLRTVDVSASGKSHDEWGVSLYYSPKRRLVSLALLEGFWGNVGWWMDTSCTEFFRALVSVFQLRRYKENFASWAFVCSTVYGWDIYWPVCVFSYLGLDSPVGLTIVCMYMQEDYTLYIMRSLVCSLWAVPIYFIAYDWLSGNSDT